MQMNLKFIKLMENYNRTNNKYREQKKNSKS